MPQFIVTAKKLNKRRSPAADFSQNNIVGQVFKGFTFEGVEETNIPNPSLGKWYKDRDGFFYWGGGVQLKTSAVASTVIDVPSGIVNYQKLFNALDTIWFSQKGKNVKVAILDTGFFLDHPDFSHLKNSVIVKDFGENINASDKLGHGTHILGLLAGNGSGMEGIIGLVPEAEYFLYKVVRDNIGFIDVFAAAAIEDSIAQGVNIINLSFNVPSSPGSLLDRAIQKAISNKIQVVAAAGENADLIQERLVFPAQFSGVISVGVVDKFFADHLNLPFNPMLDFLMPFNNIKSCWVNDALGFYKEEKGSSMATALVTGVLASILTTGINKDDVIATLKNKVQLFAAATFEEQKLQINKV